MPYVSISAKLFLQLFYLIFFFRFDGVSYQSAGTSAYSHRLTYGLSNYRGRALTTGCSDAVSNAVSCSVKTELMDMNTLTWSIGPDYPFTIGVSTTYYK